MIDYTIIHESAITNKEYLLDVCETSKVFTIYEDVGYPGGFEYEIKGTGKLEKSDDENHVIKLLDFYGKVKAVMGLDEIEGGYWIINEIPTSNSLNEIDLNYGVIAKFDNSELWYEPITDELNGFVLYNKDGLPVSMYTKCNR